jgi:hypothetical protein
MKKTVFLALLATFGMAAHAGPVVHAKASAAPFAYSEEPGMRILFYKKACDVPGISKEWHYAVYHHPYGYNSGCWRPLRDHPGNLAEVCPTSKDDSGAVEMGNACIAAGGRGVFAGDPEARPY